MLSTNHIANWITLDFKIAFFFPAQ
ncbi:MULTISPECIES: tryptophanase leader peptide [Vibrio]|nr:tryptophanase leader peptide [Vibrio sp. dhg]